LAKNYWQVANLLVYAASWNGALAFDDVNPQPCQVVDGKG